VRPPVPNIWQMQSKGDVDSLIEALRHPDAGTRRGSAAALRALGAWQAVPALQAALAIETDWQVHAAITAALQYLDHDIHVEQLVNNRDVRGLSKMLNSTRIEDVLTACNALGSLGDRLAVEHLVMVFKNSLIPGKVRLAAAEALLKLESAPAVVTLLGALRREDWQVRRNAAAVLGQLQATWAVEPLIKAMNDDNQDVRRTAAAALRRMGTPDALEALKHFEEAPASEQEPEITPPPNPDTARLEALRPITARLPLPPTPPPGPAFTQQPVSPKTSTNIHPTVGSGGVPAPVAAEGKKKTGRLPPLPEQAEAPKQPAIKQLLESIGLPRTGHLPPLIDTPQPAAKSDPLDALFNAETRPSTIRQLMGTEPPPEIAGPPAPVITPPSVEAKPIATSVDLLPKTKPLPDLPPEPTGSRPAPATAESKPATDVKLPPLSPLGNTRPLPDLKPPAADQQATDETSL